MTWWHGINDMEDLSLIMIPALAIVYATYEHFISGRIFMDTKFIQITDDEFADKFKPMSNHLNDNASFSWGDNNGCLYETYGEELNHVQRYDPARVWTLVETDGVMSIISGYHHVNRLGYIITEVAVPRDTEIEVQFDHEENEEEVA